MIRNPSECDYPEDFLDSFEDEEELKNYLVEKGYKGDRLKDRSCPIANCIRNEFNKRFESPQVFVGSIEYYIPRSGVRVAPLSDTCINFIQSFDQGKHPELIKK